MIHKFSVHRRVDESAPSHLRKQLPDLISWRDYYIDFTDKPSADQLFAVGNALINQFTERVEVDAPLPENAVQVSYQRGITDNESDSIVALCAMVGANAVAAKVGTAYQSGEAALIQVIDTEACNHNIETLYLSEPVYDTLLPTGSYAPCEWFDLRNLDDVALHEIGRGNGRSLELDKMQRIQSIQNELGLESISDAMLESLDARWSDHCAHTTWKSLGDLLQQMVQSSRSTENPNIVSMFYDNAGIWDFYDGYGIAIKAETHNGPSAVSAYFGQLTKIGGVLRDILGTGLGADPIGVFEYTATGLPESPSPIAGRPTSKQIANETIRAVKEYGTTFGVPMMSSRMVFHDDYRAKPFALGGSIGLIPLDKAQKGTPQPGDLALIIGGLTGSDGIHGASTSSAGASSMETSAVQIGSPLEEIKFREAILELRDESLLRAVTDLGAAGVNSAFGEMGEDTGVWINTALVPLKTAGLPLWRVLLSESQERMALAIAPSNLDRARAILQKHQVRNAVIGRFTGAHRYTVVHDEALTEDIIVNADVDAMPSAKEVGFDLPYEVLKYRPAPKEVGVPHQSWVTTSEWPQITVDKLPAFVEKLVTDVDIQDQSFADSQYDSSVGGHSFYGPDIGANRPVPSAYWAAKPLYGNDAAIVFNTAFNPWLFEAHPVHAARQELLSLITGQVLAGVDVFDVCLCDNFYTPHLEPQAEEWLVAMVKEVTALATRLRTPFISGKDSSAGSVNTDEGIVSVPPAVFLSALGKVPDAATLRPERWTKAGNLLVQVGLTTSSLAGTAAARVLDLEANDVDEISVDEAEKFLNALQGLPLDLAPSGRLIASGGILGAAVIGTLASDVGAELTIVGTDVCDLLREHRVAALLEVPEELVPQLPAELNPRVVGKLNATSTSLAVNGTQVLNDAAMQAWSTSFERELS